MEKRNFTILVIDDEPADIEILRRLLGEIEGWKISLLPCNDAGMVREEALSSQADLIFLDYLLGAETGIEIFHEIRKGGNNLPVVMLTGHGSEEVAVEAMKAGVSDYLIKGRITPDSLRLVISNALQKFGMKQTIGEQREALLDAERQRVMMESVGATCHHFGQPLTTMLCYLELLAKGEGIEESDKPLMLEQCLEAAETMKAILKKFQDVSEYRTRPYLADDNILDIGLDSIYGTSRVADNKEKRKPRPGNQWAEGRKFDCSKNEEI